MLLLAAFTHTHTCAHVHTHAHVPPPHTHTKLAMRQRSGERLGAKTAAAPVCCYASRGTNDPEMTSTLTVSLFFSMSLRGKDAARIERPPQSRVLDVIKGRGKQEKGLIPITEWHVSTHAAEASKHALKSENRLAHDVAPSHNQLGVIAES